MNQVTKLIMFRIRWTTEQVMSYLVRAIWFSTKANPAKHLGHDKMFSILIYKWYSYLFNNKKYKCKNLVFLIMKLFKAYKNKDAYAADFIKKKFKENCNR